MEYIYIVYEHNYDESGVLQVYDTLQKAEAFIAAAAEEDKPKPGYQRRHLVIQTWEVQ